MNEIKPEQIRDTLGMKPHPEGGHFVESFRDNSNDGERGYSTAIYFLLEAGEISHWHKVTDAAEIWHYYAGSPLLLTLSHDGHCVQKNHLGPDILAGQRPQIVVPANCWQTATSLGSWTLVGCTVAPGFDFSSFVLAEPEWRPVPRKPESS